MSLELLNTFGTFGTFIVIAATAIAALAQLRHARGSNQIAAVTELNAEAQTPQYEAAEHAVRTELEGKLRDPEFRYELDHRTARTSETRAFTSKIITVGNLYEGMGLLIKTGLLDRELALDFWALQAGVTWDRLAPVVAIFRRDQGDSVWENFEYFAVLSKAWLSAHPKGAYPSNVERMGLKDEWLEADKQYAASRAPA